MRMYGKNLLVWENSQGPGSQWGQNIREISMNLD
jgi:hypothetical protein